MIITSVVLLAAAFALLIIGAVQGNPTMLGVSLGAGAAGALALFAGNASARRIAVARGVPVEAILASRVRRTPAGQVTPAGDATEAPAATEATRAAPPTPAPIDGYDEMSAAEVTRLVASGVMADEDLSDMLVYEASHRRRRAVLTALMDVVGPDPMPDAEQADETSVAGSVRRRLRGGRTPARTGAAAEAPRTARQTTLTEDDADDRRFARPDPGSPVLEE